MFQTNFIEKIEIHILCSIVFFFFTENRSVYDIMWKNSVERGRPQKKIWRMVIACWISRATNMHSEFVILTAFPQ